MNKSMAETWSSISYSELAGNATIHLKIQIKNIPTAKSKSAISVKIAEVNHYHLAVSITLKIIIIIIITRSSEMNIAPDINNNLRSIDLFTIDQKFVMIYLKLARVFVAINF